MICSHTYWQSPAGDEYEVHYVLYAGEIKSWSLYPKPDFDISRKDELDIFALIYDDAEFERNEA